MKIYILRHLATTDNEQGINGAQTDTPLSEKGKLRAKELVPELSENTYDAFIVSPLQRTLQTIQPYLDTLDNPKIIIEPLTIERDLGTLTNSRDGDGLIETHRKEQGLDNISWTPPEGESIHHVYARARKFLENLKRLQYDSVLVSGHQNFLRCFEMLLLGRPAEDFYIEEPPLLKNGERRVYEINTIS
jgi:broad specificity phosphatase PhoE